MNKTRIVALTDAGRRLGLGIQKQVANSDIWFKPQPFAEKVQEAFRNGDRLILICATGIAVRILAPVLEDKHKDPAVLVLDEAGEFVIPLLSGHQGGANEWARTIAEYLGAKAVLTTAKPYLAPVYCVGIGCERDCPERDLKQLLEHCLNQANLTIEQISSINSIDIKSDESGLVTLCRQLNLPFNTWSVCELRSVEKLLSQRSNYVFKQVGVYGVAESAALFSVRDQTHETPELVLTKQKSAKATCAIALSYPSVIEASTS